VGELGELLHQALIRAVSVDQAAAVLAVAIQQDRGYPVKAIMAELHIKMDQVEQVVEELAE
jgi:hypothetical protein